MSPAVLPSRITGPVALLLALVLPLALVATWVSTVLTDTEQYVATVAPLADEPEIQQAVVRRLEDRVMEAIALDRRSTELAERLGVSTRGGRAAVAERLESALRTPVRRALTTAVTSELFADGWRAANRVAHQEMVRALESDRDLTANGDIDVRLVVALDTVTAVLEQRGIDVSGLPSLESSFRFIGSEDLERARGYYSWMSRVGVWLLVGWLLVAVVLLVCAAERLRAARLLAGGALVSTLLLAGGVWWGRGHLIGGADEVDQPFVTAAWDILLGDLRISVLWCLALAAATLLATWLAGRRRPLSAG